MTLCSIGRRHTEPGWKSDMEKQIRLSGWNLAEGVSICRVRGQPLPAITGKHHSHTLIPGGLKGYSGGNSRTPWYSPPAKGESSGPRCRKRGGRSFRRSVEA